MGKIWASAFDSSPKTILIDDLKMGYHGYSPRKLSSGIQVLEDRETYIETTFRSILSIIWSWLVERVEEASRLSELLESISNLGD